MPDELTKAIATDLGIAELPAEEQQKVIAAFGEVALKAATIAVVGKLAPDKHTAFAELATKGDAKAVQEFLNREVPEHEELAKAAVAEEIRRFKEAQSS